MGSERAEALAERFETASGAVRRLVATTSDAELQATCPSERCTVAALACHVADVHLLVSGWVQSVLDRRGLPSLSMDDVNRANEEGFARDRACSREETLQRLTHNAESAAEVVRALTDTELDATAPFPLFGGATVSVQTLVEQFLIGDPLCHLPSIQSALGQAG
jgi:hypothetical protein